MKRVLLLASAEAELLEARRWYDKQAPGLGGRFLEAVHEVLRGLPRRPAAFPRLARTEARKALVKNFPYTVIFRDELHALTVYAVAHQKRKPRYWHPRLGPG